MEKKNVFIQALKALYEKVETIDFKESIFVYILYSINILNFFIPSNDKVIFFVFVGNIVGYSNSRPLPYRDHSFNVTSLDVLFLLPFTGQSPRPSTVHGLTFPTVYRPPFSVYHSAFTVFLILIVFSPSQKAFIVKRKNFSILNYRRIFY